MSFFGGKMDAAFVNEMLKTFGFPVLVAGYVLVRMENTMKDLIKVITDLNANVLLLINKK